MHFLFFPLLFLLYNCQSIVQQDSNTTSIYALIADSLIKGFNKDSLTVFIQNTTHMEYEYKGFNETLFNYFKYDLPESECTLVISFVKNNQIKVELNIDDIFNHPLLVNMNATLSRIKQ